MPTNHKPNHKTSYQPILKNNSAVNKTNAMHALSSSTKQKIHDKN